MKEQFSRTELMLGADAMQRLASSRVAVFGVGGVGGHCVEALVRSGVGAIDIFDNDDVSVSNINRQMFATHKTVGMNKVDAAEERLLEINPELKITKHAVFFTPDNADEFDFSIYDYVVDAIDTVAGKLALVEKSQASGTPIICSMGAGNKMDPTAFKVADIYKTSVCPLAKTMRYECKKRGIKHLKCVYSEEVAKKPSEEDMARVMASEGVENKRQIPSSNAFVPSVVGLIIASEVIKDLVKGC